MPDIPLDTLIILLLVLASLFGRIFQKKREGQDTPSPEPFQPDQAPQDEEEGGQPRQVDLGEALRDFWQKAQQSAQPQPEPELGFEIEEPPPPLLHQQFHETDVVQKAHSADDADDNRVRQHMEEAQHKVESDHYEIGVDDGKKGNALVAAVVRDIRQGDSLRKAFVLREILGQPVSLRNESGHETHA
ncbi:uncharacterized protein METZ01_LOCUS391166 [marine metagenome]|uniref:Uncharacterized protein n=1 Tax=marine metagenome TaxID=408172 RepID=A0A382UVM4_9ZZZZ